MKNKLFAVLTLALLSTLNSRLSTVFAASKTWDGSSNGNWNTAANWTNNVVPANGDDLIFPTTATRYVITNDFPNLRVNSITFGTGINFSYLIRGNPITLTNGIAAQQDSPGANTIAIIITNAVSQTFNCLNAGASLTVSSNILLGAPTLTVTGSGNTTLSGVISGTGGITKLGAGTLIFSGGSLNNYTGATSVEEGVLELGKNTAIGSSASLTVGDGVGGVDADVVRYTADHSIDTSVPIIIKESGLLSLNGFDDSVGLLTLIGGDISTGTGTLTMAGNLTATSLSGNSAFISGNLALGVATRTFTVTNGVQTSDLTIAAAISGTVGMIKAEAGSMRLTSSNSFSGAITVNDGVLRLDHNFAAGTTAGGVTVNGDSVLELINGTHVGNEPLTLNNSSSGATSALNVSAANSNSWAGSIVLQLNAEVNVVTGGTLNLLGSISGAGGLTKVDAGTLVFSGGGANTYNGHTIVNEGVLELAKANAIANTDSLTIGDGVGGIGADIVRYLINGGINSPVPITIAKSGLLDLNGFTGGVGPLSLIGGDIDTGSGTLTMNNNLTATSVSGNGSIISGNLALGASTRTFTVTDGAFGTDLQVSAAVSGTGGITKAGDGTMFLTSSNSFSGALAVGDGVVTLENGFAAGTTAGGVSVTGDASLQLINGAQVGVEALTLNSSGALQGGSGSNSWAGTITLGANSIISVLSAQTLNLLGAITGAGGLTKINPGTLIYSGGSANTYTNTTTVNDGTLLLKKTVANGSIPGPLIIGDGAGGANADVVRLQTIGQLDGPVTVNSSGLFDLNGINDVFGSLAGSGNVTLGGASILFGGDNTSTVFSGEISETGSVAKTGSGTMTLSGNNTYTGTTTVSSGKLLVDGVQPQSPVTINGGGTLGGTGTVGNITNISGGVVAPGASPGILTCSNVNFSGTSSDFTVELNGSNPGTGYDQLNVRGGVTLANSTLHATLGFQSAISNSFTIINNDGSEAVTNTFNGLAQNATVFINGVPFRISYTGGSGNDVVLTQLVGLPILSILRSANTNVVLSWPTNVTGFILEANTNLNTSIWTVVSPPPVVNGTNNVVTNGIIGLEKYYRLRAP